MTDAGIETAPRRTRPHPPRTASRPSPVRLSGSVRARGDETMARHFERRVEADCGRADGLRGEIAALKQDLRLITGTGPRRDEPGARSPTTRR